MLSNHRPMCFPAFLIPTLIKPWTTFTILKNGRASPIQITQTLQLKPGLRVPRLCQKLLVFLSACQIFQSSQGKWNALDSKRTTGRLCMWLHTSQYGYMGIFKIILQVVQPFWYVWTEYQSWVELTLCFYPKSYLQFTPKSCCPSINCHVCFPGRSSLASSEVNKSLLLPLFTNHSFLAQCNLFSREGDGTPLQYSCLENPMDRGAWLAAVHGVAKSQTQLSDFTFTFHFHALEKEMATHSSVLAWRIPGTGQPGGLLSLGSPRVGHD